MSLFASVRVGKARLVLALAICISPFSLVILAKGLSILLIFFPQKQLLVSILPIGFLF